MYRVTPRSMLTCMDTSPTPYAPSDPGNEEKSHLKPWQRRRPGESEAERNYRALRSCWKCGHFEPDATKLDEHEQTHR
jgi:hypothetical protein